MDEQNNENLNSENEAADQTTEDENLETTLEETEDVEVLKEKNRQLFARAKKAEGFTLKDGQWVKKSIEKKPEAKPASEMASPDEIDKKVDEKVNQRLEKRDLEELDLPDNIKQQIQRVAQISGIPIKQAAKDPYIVSQIEQHTKSKAAEEASISRTNKSGSKEVFSVDEPPKVDMNTPEGRAKWDNYLEFLKTQEK